MPAPPPTPQLAFREMTPDDLDDMAALLGDPEVMRYYPRPKNHDQASAWISWNQRLYRKHGYGLWLLSLRDTGRFVGDCGLTPQQVDGVTEIEVGYHSRLPPGPRLGHRSRGRLPGLCPRRPQGRPPDRDH
jgi:RimJ/RimL family protein N-acetyltransferase